MVKGKIRDDSERVVKMRRRTKVPIWKKCALTAPEAAKYCGIGQGRLREMSDEEDCKFVLWVGSKRMFKRRLLDEFIRDVYSI